MIRNLKIDYKIINSVNFTALNGIDIKVKLNGTCTLSVTHNSFGTHGIQADFSKTDLNEYIEYLKTFYNQMA